MISCSVEDEIEKKNCHLGLFSDWVSVVVPTTECQAIHLLLERTGLCLFSDCRCFIHSLRHLTYRLWWRPSPGSGYTGSFSSLWPAAAWEWLSRITGIHWDISPHTGRKSGNAVRVPIDSGWFVDGAGAEISRLLRTGCNVIASSRGWEKTGKRGFWCMNGAVWMNVLGA